MNNLKEEIWKKINNYPDYEISNFGRIKSFKQDSINGKVLSGGKDKDGYRIIGLTKNKKRKTEKIHRLLLETFDPIENMKSLKVNHKNGIKDDNRFPENVEWCTQSENEKHAHKIGLKNFKGNKAFSRGCGENNPFYGKKHSEKTKNKMREKRKNSDYFIYES